MGIVEKRVEEELKGKSRKEKDAATSSIYLILALLLFSIIFALSGFAVVSLIMLLLYPILKKKFYKVFGYLLILNLLVTLFFKINNGNIMSYVGVFEGEIKENYSSSTHFIYSNWRNYKFNNDFTGFKERLDYFELEPDPVGGMPDWVSRYEHFEGDKWYTFLIKEMYNGTIGNFINPDPGSEGEIPRGIDMPLDYYKVGIDNIYNKENYNSIINGDLNEKEKNIIKSLIVRNTSVNALMIDLISLALILGLYKVSEDS